MLRRVAGVHCVHYIEEKDCPARFAIQGLYEILRIINLRYSPPQRLYITLRTDSPTPFVFQRKPEEGLSQPLSACTDGSFTDGQEVQYTAD